MRNYIFFLILSTFSANATEITPDEYAWRYRQSGIAGYFICYMGHIFEVTDISHADCCPCGNEMPVSER